MTEIQRKLNNFELELIDLVEKHKLSRAEIVLIFSEIISRQMWKIVKKENN